MNIKFENRCGSIDIGDGRGCIDIFVPEACDKKGCRKEDACAGKILIETPKAGIKLVVVGGKSEGEIRFKC